MKLTIVLKVQDADGFGGEILQGLGMSRSEFEPTVFVLTMPVHEISKFGTGDSSWSQPEAHTQKYVEALTDFGIRPVRVFQKTDSAAGLTPLHASFWDDANPGALKGEDAPSFVADPDGATGADVTIEDALEEIEAAVAALSAKKEEEKELPRFTLHTIGYKGAKPQASFTFHAETLKDAVSKGKGWCRYHSFKYGEDAVVKKATKSEMSWNTHDEYVKDR